MTEEKLEALLAAVEKDKHEHKWRSVGGTTFRYCEGEGCCEVGWAL